MEPKKKKPKPRYGDKRISLSFSIDGKRYNKIWNGKKFSALDSEVKLVMAFGQVNTPAYNCFKTEEDKLRWVQTMVNKGEKEQFNQEGITKLIEESIEKGYLESNGNGPHITPDGVDYIATFKSR